MTDEIADISNLQTALTLTEVNLKNISDRVFQWNFPKTFEREKNIEQVKSKNKF